MATNPPGSPLAKADQAAMAHSDQQAPDAAVAPCPHADQRERTVIEVEVLGEDGIGLDGIEVRLSKGSGQALTGITSPAGLYRFQGLDPGSYKLALPELDKDAWLIKRTVALPKPESTCSSIADWQSPPAALAGSEHTHIIKHGECVGKIAEQYGVELRRKLTHFPL